MRLSAMPRPTLFQFHKGTIKTFNCLALSLTIRNFNSIKVRLKPKVVLAFKLSPAFQFHKGTIKTLIRRLRAASMTLFQFHKGTIKTVNNIYRATFKNISIP